MSNFEYVKLPSVRCPNDVERLIGWKPIVKGTVYCFSRKCGYRTRDHTQSTVKYISSCDSDYKICKNTGLLWICQQVTNNAICLANFCCQKNIATAKFLLKLLSIPDKLASHQFFQLRCQATSLVFALITVWNSPDRLWWRFRLNRWLPVTGRKTKELMYF